MTAGFGNMLGNQNLVIGRGADQGVTSFSADPRMALLTPDERRAVMLATGVNRDAGEILDERDRNQAKVARQPKQEYRNGVLYIDGKRATDDQNIATYRGNPNIASNWSQQGAADRDANTPIPTSPPPGIESRPLDVREYAQWTPAMRQTYSDRQAANFQQTQNDQSTNTPSGPVIRQPMAQSPTGPIGTGVRNARGAGFVQPASPTPAAPARDPNPYAPGPMPHFTNGNEQFQWMQAEARRKFGDLNNPDDNTREKLQEQWNPGVIDRAKLEANRFAGNQAQAAASSWVSPNQDYAAMQREVQDRIARDKQVAKEDFQSQIARLGPNETANAVNEFEKYWDNQLQESIAALGGKPSGQGRYVGGDWSQPGKALLETPDWHNLVNKALPQNAGGGLRLQESNQSVQSRNGREMNQREGDVRQQDVVINTYLRNRRNAGQVQPPATILAPIEKRRDSQIQQVSAAISRAQDDLNAEIAAKKQADPNFDDRALRAAVERESKNLLSQIDRDYADAVQQTIRDFQNQAVAAFDSTNPQPQFDSNPYDTPSLQAQRERDKPTQYAVDTTAPVNSLEGRAAANPLSSILPGLTSRTGQIRR